jgi:tryptophan 7-halogenase
MYKLLEYFPDRSFDPRAIDAYNAEAINEIERIRDFIVLHYCLTQRTDTSLWRDCQNMSLPDSLSQRIDLYRTTGRIRHQVGDLFTELSWFYILEGMGVEPERYDPLVDVIKFEQFKGILASMARAVDEAAKAAPSHDGYFVRYEDKSGTAAR